MKYLHQDWAKAKIVTPTMQFFVQRWLELLDRAAPVTHRAPISGGLDILRELDELRAALREGRSTKANVEAVEQEAFGDEVNRLTTVGTVTADPIITTLVPEIADQRKALSEHFSNRTPPEQVIWRRSDAFARVLVYGLNDRYVKTLLDALRHALFGGSGTTDERIASTDTLTTALVSELLSSGFADSFLRVHTRTLDASFGNAGTEEVRFGEFADRLLAPHARYTIVFRAHGAKRLWQRWPSGTAVALNEDCELPPLKRSAGFEATIDKFEKPDPSIRFLEHECDAPDDHAATRLAYLEVERIVDIVQAELPDVSAADIQDIATRRAGQPATLKVLSADKAELEFRPLRLSGRDRSRALTGFATRVMAADADPASMKRVAGAIRYFRISTQEQWAESSFTNVWTALETLAHEAYDTVVIERVVRSVTPLIASLKMRDITDDLSAYIWRSGLGSSSAFTSSFNHLLNPAGFIEPVQLLGAMADPTQASKLASLIPESPLVQFRIAEYSRVVQKGGTIAERVFRTSRRIEWQIRRLYRQRNAIVHGASRALKSERLLEHLQLYAFTTITTLAEILASRKGIKTVEDAVASVDHAFHHWLSSIRRTGSVFDGGVELWRRCYNPPFARHVS